jgi:hypothetical protein
VTAAEPLGSYPHELAGEVTTPPRQLGARTIALARQAHLRQLAVVLEAPEPLGWVMPDWRLAGAIVQLGTEADQANPGRDKSSDGTVGDARHAGGGPGTAAWKASDHNPWVSDGAKGVVRARDLDVDGLDLPAAFERLRAKAAAGQLPQVIGGGYAILNGRITAPDWSGWRQYLGADPHVSHGHVSVGVAKAAYDTRTPWGIFTADPAPAPAPPAPAPPASWTGPDLTGRGVTLRGVQGNNGPRVAAWQQGLADRYPIYRHQLGELAADGWWGPVTTAWNREFGQRSGIRSADGLNVGPQLAMAYWRAGIRP